jgi:hypothetical protein
MSVSRGALALEVAVPDSGNCFGITGGGDITLRLPVTSPARLFARTEDGTVRVTGLALADRLDSAGYVSGTLGAGTAVIHLETKKGNVEVIGLDPSKGPASSHVSAAQSLGSWTWGAKRWDRHERCEAGSRSSQRAGGGAPSRRDRSASLRGEGLPERVHLPEPQNQPVRIRSPKVYQEIRGLLSEPPTQR